MVWFNNGKLQNNVNLVIFFRDYQKMISLLNCFPGQHMKILGDFIGLWSRYCCHYFYLQDMWPPAGIWSGVYYNHPIMFLYLFIYSFYFYDLISLAKGLKVRSRRKVLDSVLAVVQAHRSSRIFRNIVSIWKTNQFFITLLIYMVS